MQRTAAIAVLLVPAVVIAGLVAGLAVKAEQAWAHDAAAMEYADALAAAREAHAAALDLREDALIDRARAEAALADAAALEAAPSLLETAALAELAEPVARLEAFDRGALPLVPSPPHEVVGASTEQYRTGTVELASWADELEAWAAQIGGGPALQQAVAAVRTATLAAAGTATSAAQAVLDANLTASEESRGALTTALADLASVLERGGLTAGPIGVLTAAAQSVEESAAAAAAAATAAGGGGGGAGCEGPWCHEFEYGSYEWAVWLCNSPLNDISFPGFDGEPVVVPRFPCTVHGDGFEWTIYG